MPRGPEHQVDQHRREVHALGRERRRDTSTVRGLSAPGHDAGAFQPRQPVAEDAGRDALAGVQENTEGNTLCGVEVGRFMFRVGAEQEPRALAMPGATPMDITGRPMKGFIWVDAGAAATKGLPFWIALAARYVSTLPGKQTAPRLSRSVTSY